jgi:hypothetical protein
VLLVHGPPHPVREFYGRRAGARADHSTIAPQ